MRFSVSLKDCIHRDAIMLSIVLKSLIYDVNIQLGKIRLQISAVRSLLWTLVLLVLDSF